MSKDQKKISIKKTSVCLTLKDTTLALDLIISTTSSRVFESTETELTEISRSPGSRYPALNSRGCDPCGGSTYRITSCIVTYYV